MTTHATTTTVEPDAFERIVPEQLAAALRRSFVQTTAAEAEVPTTATDQPATTTALKTARTLIVDVRGDDYDAGHIASAVHHPESGFHDDATVDALVQQYKHEETIVFHCQQSQVRGPFCARRFLARLDVLLADADKKPAVQVLTGGYAGFSEQYEGDTELLETAEQSKPNEQS